MVRGRRGYNTCYNCLDRHVDGGRADQTALIYHSRITGALKTFTYRELRDVTARFAGALRSIGIQRGDRVILYMSMIPEAAIAIGLPKTRSGKILRGAKRRIADGKDCPSPATIDDPAILEEIADTLKSIGYMD